MPPSSAITVLRLEEGEPWSVFLRRLQSIEGEIFLLLGPREEELISLPDTRSQLFLECKKVRHRLHFATKHPPLIAEARTHGIRIVDRTKHVRSTLNGHPQLDEVLRIFSPHLWRQQLKTQLQQIGLLSVPRLRIYVLVGLSGILFCFVLFRLLPSAEIHVKPRQETVSQTINMFLVQSGAQVTLPERVRSKPLIPITVKVQHALTFDHISKEFIGNSSYMDLTIINTSADTYSLRLGTRFANQAGMVFRIQDPAIVPAKGELTVRAKADDTDLYGQIIGERGNLPAGIRWDVTSFPVEEQAVVYGENRTPSSGGTTAYRTVLRPEDLDLAKKKLEQELTASARSLVDEEILLRNASEKAATYVLLDYTEFTAQTFSGFVLPLQFLGQPVTSIPVEGQILFTMFAYNAKDIFDLLVHELEAHVREGKQLVEDDVGIDRMVSHVIDYQDDLSWIKLTVDLTGTEQYILDVLSPGGALFAKRVREQVSGLTSDQALRIIRNMPEVEKVTISQWPPWNRTLPRIPSHISIVPES